MKNKISEKEGRANALWVQRLTKGAIVNCWYKCSRKTVFVEARECSWISTGFLVRVEHCSVWLHSLYISPCKSQGLTGFTRPRTDTDFPEYRLQPNADR